MGIDRSPADELPDYLVEVVAREAFQRDHPGETWDDADETTKNGHREEARIILMARKHRSDIKR